MLIKNHFRRRKPNFFSPQENAVPGDRITFSKLKKELGEKLFTNEVAGRWSTVRTLLKSELASEDAEGKTNKSGLYEYLCSAAPVHTEQICDLFHIELRTYYAWRESILLAGMLIAAEKGYLSVIYRKLL